MNDTRQRLTTFTPPRRLTKQQFRVVALIYRDELNYEQVAKEMGISVRTVQAHIERAAMFLPGHGPSVWKVLRWSEELLEMGFSDEAA
jgi:DNA-binding CsgD family transcriptional regulator